jgi:Golgi nucleoside diphosphatase
MHRALMQEGAPSNVKYIVMIDAGSTGSRAHVHAYTLDSSRPLPVVEESKNKKIKPGLSSCAKEPTTAAIAMKELIEFIKSQVPQDLWASTPVHLHVRNRHTK